MKTTRRQFFTRVLLGAAATVPVLLIGRGVRSTNVWGAEQDRISVDFDDMLKRFDTYWIDVGHIRFKHSLAETVGSMRSLTDA